MTEAIGSCAARHWGAVKTASVLFLAALVASAVSAQGSDPGPAQVRNLNNQILRIASDVRSATPSGISLLRAEAANLIEMRAAALNQLIEVDPGQALSLAFSPDLLATLAKSFPEAAARLETYGTWQGPVERWVFDGAGLKSSRTVTRMRVGQQDLEIHFAGPEPAVKSGDLLQATGVLAGNQLAVAGSTTQASTTTPTCSTTGVQNTATLLVTFPGVALPAGVTQQSIHDIFFGNTGHSMDGFLREASYGQTSAAGTVLGPYTLTGSYSSCSDVGGAVMNDAIAAAVAGGTNLSNYSRVFLIFPDVFACGWAGFASSGCSLSSSSGTFNASSAYIAASYTASRDQGVALAAHEIGHNFGLMHSGTLTDATAGEVLGPLTSPGSRTDMGDYWSTMGATLLGLYPAAQKAEVLGWMAPNTNYQVVQTSGTFTLQPLETAPAGFQAIKVQRGTGSNAWLWVEYRQPIGNYDSTLFTQPFSGALIHYEDATTPLGQTYLPNFTPADTSRLSPALTPGQIWADPYSNLSLSVLSATPGGLTINVEYGAMPCTRANPTVTLSPLNPSASSGSSVNYTASVTNNDGAGCSASTFNLTPSQPSGWSASLSLSAISLSPGQTTPVTLVENIPSSTTAATYSLNLTASSASDTGAGSANCAVFAPSLTDALSVSAATFSTRQTVQVTSMVLYNSSAAVGAAVTFTLTKSNGSTVSGTATTDSTGKAAWSYKLTQKDPVGSYSVTSKASYSSQIASAAAVTFTVQ